MTDKLRAAAGQALEALENTTPTGFNMERDKQFFAAITALREALSEEALQRLTRIHKEMEVAYKPRNQCAETCERAKLCATCHRAIDGAEHQEPIAWLYFENGEETFGALDGYRPNDAVPLYIGTKPTKQPLTDDEIWKNDAIMAANSGYGATFETLREIVRAIEAAHGIRDGGEVL